MENPYKSRELTPKVRYNVDKEDVIIYTICKAGWYGMNPGVAWMAPVDEVIKAYQFEIMARQYRATAFELNKANNK